MFRKMICLLLFMFVCNLSSPSKGETEDLLSLTDAAAMGDTELRVSLAAPLQNVRVLLLSGEENVLEEAFLEDQQLTLKLRRSLRMGEPLSLLITATNVSGNAMELSLAITVENAFHQKLPALSRRAEEFLSIWKDVWLPAGMRGEIPLNILWRQLPFALWPDEAPEILVQAAEVESLIYLSEPLPEGWQVSVGEGIPVVYTPCEYDEKFSAWVAPETFDSVWLIHNMTDRAVRIAIEYRRANSFLPSYPVVEWEQEEEVLSAFNCYGWGTTRSYEGGMMAVVANSLTIYAEYDSAGTLISYMNPDIDCVFDPSGTLLEGILPEGYADPVQVR